jgi:hypothetical protein
MMRRTSVVFWKSYSRLKWIWPTFSEGSELSMYMSTREIERFCRKAICRKQQNKALISADGEMWHKMHPRLRIANGLRTKLLFYLQVSVLNFPFFARVFIRSSGEIKYRFACAGRARGGGDLFLKALYRCIN